MKIKVENALTKKARNGFWDYPIATVACRRPASQLATKLAVGISANEGALPVRRKWQTETRDIRYDEQITREALRHIQMSGAKSVSALAKIIGCPPEEGIDYPAGEACPACLFWAGKDRWTED